MAVLKCKMCGGNLEFTEGQSYGTCDSCGSTMTLPKANDERVLNLFNRANHYRRQNEFDKALATYESILEEDSNNAEAYWGCVLSRYGIEYVEDARTHERIPTCHRVQNESILADLDYQKALKNAPDSHSQKLYEAEAEKISEIQKGILNIARNEKPYDIFICYKETDSVGQRTIDSTLAQDIYYQLTNEGYKVFFSRITLEDKLGQEYEPYIFAALNSAKVMLVIGTKSEHFNAIWVKNEWARFLKLTKRDKSKLIIPCYREMDAYELPEELSLFQSQDMSKIGFMQDLVRGIKKVLTAQVQDRSTVVQSVPDYATQEAAQLKRAFLLLEEAEWDKADELLENVLNINPENARAYLGKLMVEIKVNKEEILGKRPIDYSRSSNYIKVLRFGDDELKSTLTKYCDAAKERFEKEEQQKREETESTRLKFFELEDASKRDKLAKLRITIVILTFFMIILGSIVGLTDETFFVFIMMWALLCFEGFIIIFNYSKYSSLIAKQKANMILLEEKYGNRELNADNKKLLEIFANDSSIAYKGEKLSINVVKKMCRSHGINVTQQTMMTFVDLINGYKPQK